MGYTKAMSWTIRNVQIEDAKAITEILNPIIEAGIHTVLDKPFTVEEEQDFIANFTEHGIFHIAENPVDKKLSGFQTVEPFASYTKAFDHVGLIGTFVGHSTRRQGVASSLFSATFEAMQKLGYEKVFAYVRGDNPTALATYQKHGFEIIGTAKKHAKVNGIYVDEILIEKFL